MAKLSPECGEEVSAKMMVAVPCAMLAKDLQERVLDKCAVIWNGAKNRGGDFLLLSQGGGREHCEIQT